jgi:hypothetical protein
MTIESSLGLDATQSNTGSDTYTILVRGQPFHLSKAQISFESPNLLTNSFLGDFAEASSRTLKLDNNLDIFAIIVEYLSGYPILPLDDSMLPGRMSVQVATRYLAKDADYLGLTRLHESLRAPTRGALQQWAGLETYAVDLVDVLNNRLPSSVRWTEKSPQTLVDVSEGGKSVLVIARNVVLR